VSERKPPFFKKNAISDPNGITSKRG